jgi:hypothetical protein
VRGLALFGLVACAGFVVRAGGPRDSVAPTLQVNPQAPQTSPQGLPGSQAGQPSTRTGATPSQTTPGGRGAGGYGSGWEWWKDDAVKKELGLRPNQAADIDHIYTRRLKDMDPVIQSYVPERALLVKMIADRLVDDSQLDLQITKVNALWSKLNASHTLMLYRISKVLDADQFAKLKVILDRHNQDERRGRGGAPAPRPFGLPR